MNQNGFWKTLWLILRSILPYLWAILAVAGSTAILLLLRQHLNTSMVAMLYLVPVLASTILWGLIPGILAAFLAFLAYNFYFIAPYHTLTVHNTQDLIALVIFLIVAVLISQLIGRAKKGLEAAIAREQETTRLYELSVGLANMNSLQEIATAIVDKTMETFQSTRVEIAVEAILGEAALLAKAGIEPYSQMEKPIAVAPLETVRGFLGEIRLWRKDTHLSSTEDRLLHAFVAQGALALEKTALAHAEKHTAILEESDRLKSALLSSVSHELRTPLATIKAAVTSLLSEQVNWDSQARHELLSAVDEETDLLNHLVGNLLDMSRIEAGALKPTRRWNLLSEIVDGVVVRLRRVLADFHLSVAIPDDLPLIPVDYVQIEQVFINLLSNSAKYAPPGSQIAIQARLQPPDTLFVQVANEGPPVAPDHLDRIFDKFFRVTNADKVSGTGLGLSICKGIIEVHGGQIWAENLPAGFAFNFTLPLTLDGMSPPVIHSEEL